MKENQIDTTLFADVPAGAQREEMLDANALRSEKRMIKRPYSEIEKDNMRRELVRDLTQLQKLDEEFRALKKKYDDEMAPLKTNVKKLTTNLRTGYIEVNEDVYLYDYQEAGQMAIYDRNGELIETRRLMPDERQTNIISMNRSGTIG
jgi:hypothetical protein